MRVPGIKAPLFWPLVACGLGCYAYLHPFLAVLTLLVLLPLSLFKAHRRDVLLSIMIFGLGWTRMAWDAPSFPTIPTPSLHQWECTFHSDLNASCTSPEFHRPLLLEVPGAEMHPTEIRGTCWGVLSPFNSFSSFDYAGFKRSQGIAGRIKLLSGIQWENTEAQTLLSSLVQWCMRTRSYITDSLKINFSGPTEGLLLALTLGDKANLDSDVRISFANAGLAHILAVSGYHIGLVGFIPLLFIHHRRRFIQCLGGALFGFIWVYVALCDWPISALRAATMITAFVIGKWSNRRPTGFQCWSIAGFVILMVTPYSIASLGAQLSFAAVAAIFLFLEHIRTLNSFKRVAGFVGIPIAAQGGTVAWTCSVFGQFPWTFLPMNLIAAPCMYLLGMAYLFWWCLKFLNDDWRATSALADLISYSINGLTSQLTSLTKNGGWVWSTEEWNPLLWWMIGVLYFGWNIIALRHPHCKLEFAIYALLILAAVLPWCSL